MSNQWFNDSGEDDQLICPKCGGDDIHFDPAIHYGAQRSESNLDYLITRDGFYLMMMERDSTTS